MVIAYVIEMDLRKIWNEDVKLIQVSGRGTVVASCEHVMNLRVSKTAESLLPGCDFPYYPLQYTTTLGFLVYV